MSAPEPRPGRDPDTIPTFLRETRRATSPAPDATPPLDRRAIPRPSTPAQTAESPRAPRLDPSTLPMPSLSRRRVVTAAGILAAALMTLGFVRQVGEASAATTRADDLREANTVLREDVAGLERDLDNVQDPRFIRLAGRAFGLGGPGEIPFALAAGAPELPADAPGSASVRLGAEPIATSPLDAWLEVLFGSTD